MVNVEGSRRLRAILAADVAGYSRLMQIDDRATVATLEAHRAIFREHIEAHEGRIVDMAGDSVLAVLDSPTEAVRAAVDIQTVLVERNQPIAEVRRMRFRIGINLGEVIAKADGTVYGDGVNIAARIEPLAEPGGICLSEDVARQIQNKIDLPLLRLGKADLKNIQMPVQIYRLVLPWERKHLPGSQRMAFSMRQRQMRRALVGAGGLLVVGGLVGTWAWRRGQTQAGLINNRIAVLPFVSMSAGTDDEYFVDGMTEELISRLSRVKGLEVIARTSIASYKGTKKKISEIAGELSVGSVLEGSVRNANGKVRITAQLINATSEAHLWSEDYDRELKDIFTVQSDIAQHVANALTAKLGAAPSAPVSEHVREAQGTGTKDLDAYNAYLKGRFYTNKGTVEGFHKAIPYYEEAIRRDPSYAGPYAGLADTFGNLVGYEAATSENYSKTKANALKALELDDSLAEAHTSLGIVKAFYDYDLAGAGEEFRRALTLNPNSAMTHDWYSFYLLFFPRWDEAIAIQRRAVQLDPLSMVFSTDLGWVLEHAGRYDEAIEFLRKALELDPDNVLLLGALGHNYMDKGMHKEALAALEKRAAITDRDPESLSILIQAYALSGEMVKALRALQEMKDKVGNTPGQAFNFAIAYKVLADRDPRFRSDMFRWLDKSYEEHAMGIVFISAVAWRPLQSDPRMIAFRKKLGLSS